MGFTMEHLRRHKWTWRFLRLIGRPLLKLLTHYDDEVCTEKGPLLIMSNHNTNLDPLFLGAAFPEYMSFVATEHVFRMGLAGRVIRYLMAPIPFTKGGMGADAVRRTLRRLKEGVNVALYAEGDRSYNGLTGPIEAATGQLARLSGATLVTYRLDGGYFTSPRWCGAGLRIGKMTGRVMHVLKPEELKAMSVEDINALIRDDLFVDAYAKQRENPVRYKGKNLAEHMETALCYCPACGQFGRLHSEGDTFSCECGFSVKYTEYGFLEGDHAPYDNITDWDKAQTEALRALADGGDGPYFSDDQMVLNEIFPDRHEETELGRGEMTLFSDRLECCGESFPIKAITGTALFGPQTFNFAYGGRYFEVKSQEVRCTRKYVTVIRHLLNKIRNEKSFPA